ncbi:monooxygenase [Pectobacterium brasiliense]|uniref:Monooxygenase n=1 Tax=Pectobacterium brasiliense TaxID=180957 RepID=A0A3S0ZXM7_9GAMM|nr:MULTISPECIES: monooxygenase [Pectobacterium]GKW27936.1 monooxygenase [Pectobacterium carotovorum subsp. carotovorum]MBN3046673.1 monooxygenase [Pectobacterium brasiliense]MBN3075194.1 monooxygenase [Pectobacterium brasiliense]MBN3083680.1 monooxygenase [Pectobacterium brasiliense]MBN3089220.1 monooxygenase [Pectobacterium brasiliense]
MSNKLLQLHFSFNGPFGHEMSRQLVDLAESINREPGFIWKIWTESEKNQEAGGIYLFKDEEAVNAYLEMHIPRIQSFGVEEVIYKIFDVNEPLTVLNHGHAE